MAPRKNPLRLNTLQLKTLTVLQAYAAAQPPRPGEAEGEVTIAIHPPHGDHFHVGSFVVLMRDATGLVNQSVWTALERKGLIRQVAFPAICTLTAEGLAYDTGLREAILHRTTH